MKPPNRDRSSPIRASILLGALAGAVVALGWLIGWIAFGTPLAFLRPADDAYYYFDVASQFVHGRGLSTDGIHTTNGFHPLWMAILLPFAVIFDAPSQNLVIAAQLLSCVGFGAAVAGIAATGRRAGLSLLAASVAALCLFVPPWRGIVGAVLEGGLTLALLGWLAFAVQCLRDRIEAGSADLKSGLAVGVLGGLTVLARLDAVWVIGVVCLGATAWVARGKELAAQPRRRIVIAILGPPAALVGAYALVNLLAFGHAVPVSGEIKSSFPAPEVSSLGDISRAIRLHPQYYALVPLAWLGVLAARARRMTIAPLLLVFVLGATAQAAYIVLFSRTGLFWWYFVGLVPAGLLAIGVLVELALTLPVSARLRRAMPVAILLGAAAIVVVPMVASLLHRTPDGEYAADTGWRIEAERAGQWSDRHLPSGVMLAMRDAGAFGYYTRQPVLNLDGVSSSYEYQDALCDGRLDDELRRSGVRYVAYHALKQDDYEHFDLALGCARNGRESVLRFDRSDEVYRGRPYWHGGLSRFVIWRLRDGALPST